MGLDKSNQPIDWAVALRPMGNHMESGDFYVIAHHPRGVLTAAVDGLGHGPEAAIAARIAVETMEKNAQESPISLVRRCHQSLFRTRGVAMTLASFDLLDQTLTWLGVGNVQGVLLRADPRVTPVKEDVITRGGVVGYQLPPLRASIIPVSRGDTLILVTDGIQTGFHNEWTATNGSPQEIADRILTRYGKQTDDALVLVVRYWGQGS